MIDLRFIVVSGKGGVGRTTVAATLARVAASKGKRVLLAAAAATDRIGRLFGQREPLGPSVTTLAPGIDGVNITPASSIHEYGLKVLRSELVTRAVFDNRAVRGVLRRDSGPGCVRAAGQGVVAHDRDARRPAALRPGDLRRSGERPRRADVAHPPGDPERDAEGPLAGDARAIKELLADPTRAALVMVTLAEDLPARETWSSPRRRAVPWASRSVR